MTQWRLTLAQADYLRELLGFDDYPFPIHVPFHGRTERERNQLRYHVREQLRAAGLLSASHYLDAGLAVVLRLLVCHTVSIDSLWIADPSRSPSRVLTACAAGRAIFASQEPVADEPLGQELVLREIPAEELIPAVLAQLPGSAPDQNPWQYLTSSSSAQFLDASSSFLIPGLPAGDRDNRSAQTTINVRKTAAGQIGATISHDLRSRIRLPVLHWFDSAGNGRYLLQSAENCVDTKAIVTIEPASLETLAYRLTMILRTAVSGLTTS